VNNCSSCNPPCRVNEILRDRAQRGPNRGGRATPSGRNLINEFLVAYLTHMKQRRTNPLFFVRETLLSPFSGNNHLFLNSCDTRIRNKVPGSTLRAARGSPRNRYPEPKQVCNPTGVFLHAHDTADEVWQGVSRVRWLCGYVSRRNRE